MKKEKFEPYIPASKKIPELTLKSILIGILFSFIFAIANAYLGLKAGTTISASIPAAILALATLKIFFKKHTILESNIIQTIATVGEGIAAGVVFTIPALLFLGSTLSVTRIFILSSLGGILGILFMIPMRRYIIVKEHNILPFPEGTACAKILIASKSKKTSAIPALIGFLTAALYKICSNIFFLWEEIPSWTVGFFKNTIFSIDATPALLGIGYIIGKRISSLMFAGGILSWFVIIPIIKTFGSADIIYPSNIPINQMSAQDIWSNYVRYIGAGAVAIGGVFSLVKIIPLIYKTIHIGIKELFAGFKSKEHIERTDKDISMAWLILGPIAIILTLWILPITSLNFSAIIILIILGFFFSAVTSITVGLVGSSSNPSSGMTITTLLITCILFLALGWTEKVYLIVAISLACVANIAICMAGATSQDLNTGYILGSTPKNQQIAEIIGVFIPALTLGAIVILLNKAYTIGSVKMPAPQATLMAMIAEGVITKKLPFILVGIGIFIGIIIHIARLPVLAFAIGIYLPLSLSSAIMFGGLVSFFIKKISKKEETREKGILISSGLIGGDALFGVIIAILTVLGVIKIKPTLFPDEISLSMFVLLSAFFLWLTLRKK